MKALTLTQPWATLVVTGRKRIETRSWRTRHRGVLAIHAAKAMPGEAQAAAALWLGVHPDELPRGAIVGIVDLVQCLPTQDVRHLISADEQTYGDFSDGRFAWFLNAAGRLPPIPVRGALGLWEWDTERQLG